MTNNVLDNCGAVIIGRNEGPRLAACLRSLAGQVACVVYVDSGSSDDSLKIAQAMNAEVVELDLKTPFTAARARNIGFDRLLELQDDLTYAQFVDGDCVVKKNWLDRARAFLGEHAGIAVVCGRRRERFPENSAYNRLCDIEWNTPVGDALACGGDALMRVDAFRAVGGFASEVIAGEEPELCVRLRGDGWKIWRLDVEMTLHDAAMTHFGQWWQRSMRAGYAYALGASMHGSAPERHWVRETWRALFWGTLLPSVVIFGSLLVPYILALLVLYPLQIARIAIRRKDLGRFSLVYAVFMVLGKFAEAVGIIRFGIDRLTGRRPAIIEYKSDNTDCR